MDSIIKKQRIASLILKEKIDELSKSEKEELTSWLQASPRNEEIYSRLQKKSFSEDIARSQQISTTRGLEDYRRRYVHKNRRLLGKWYWAAAVAVFIVGIATLFFYQEEHLTVAKTTISPGSSKAMLVLNNGEVIPLSEKNKTEIVATEELSIRNEGSQLRYTASENTKNEQATTYNELIVPKGGEFTLTLSDGTKVWLNSQSKIRYPVIFNDITREVYLEGEAYFEVTKDSRHPFHVNARNGVNIKVLGTSFNVRSYTDENAIETVLEEGSVRMSQGKDSVILSPGNKATYLPNEPIRLTTVNTELYTAWRHGQYIFMEESVENILKQLSRWYDIEVFYSNEAAKSVVFSGDVRKYDDINTLLEAMEIAGGIHFKISGKTLIVSYSE